MIRLYWIPLPCSINRAYANAKTSGIITNSRRFKSKEYQEFEQAFNDWALVFQQEIRNARNILKNNTTKLKLEITCYMPYEKLFTKEGKFKKWDASNRIKALEDLLSKLLHIDDCSFFKVSSEKDFLPDIKRGFCDVVISVHQRTARNYASKAVASFPSCNGS